MTRARPRMLGWKSKQINEAKSYLIRCIPAMWSSCAPFQQEEVAFWIQNCGKEAHLSTQICSICHKTIILADVYISITVIEIYISQLPSECCLLSQKQLRSLSEQCNTEFSGIFCNLSTWEDEGECFPWIQGHTGL